MIKSSRAILTVKMSSSRVISKAFILIQDFDFVLNRPKYSEDNLSSLNIFKMIDIDAVISYNSGRH